jgi:hypothetical protein
VPIVLRIGQMAGANIRLQRMKDDGCGRAIGRSLIGFSELLCGPEFGNLGIYRFAIGGIV